MYLLNILLGLCIGIFITSCFLIMVVNKYYFLFKIVLMILNIFLIIGLIMKKNLKISRICLLFILGLVILIFVQKLNLKMNNIYVLYIFSSIVYSCANTVPGLSATAILVNVGFYNTLLRFYNNPFSTFLSNPLLWLIFLMVFFLTSLFVLKVIYKYFNTQILNYVICVVLFINSVLLLY